MKKLKLNELKIQSFVTSLKEEQQIKLKGGNTRNPSECNQCTPPVFPTDRCDTILGDCLRSIAC